MACHAFIAANCGVASTPAALLVAAGSEASSSSWMLPGARGVCKRAAWGELH